MHIRGFFDFDYTLYDTQRLVMFITAALVRAGCDAVDVERRLEELVPEGYTFERHLELLGLPPDTAAELIRTFRSRLGDGDALLYPGVIDAMGRLSARADLVLLTFGYPDFQRMKYHGTPALHPYLSDAKFVWRSETKGDVIRGYGAHPNTWFVDDSPSHLLDVRAKAPWAQVVRISWEGTTCTPHDGDERLWKVVASLEEFIRLIDVG